MIPTAAQSSSAPASASDELDPRYKSYQWQVLIWSMVGYATFYFVRKNLSIAMPAMNDAGITKQQLGLFLTLHGLLYGVSKFVNGMIGDRVNARWFMAAGLICSAITNIFFGLSSAVIVLGIFWMLNGWFQGIGFPPCARLMTHWFRPRELATKMSIWNISHGLGAAGIVILGGYLIDWTHKWQMVFFVPAGIAIFVALLLMIFLRDTPQSVGLPPLEGTVTITDVPQVDGKSDFAKTLRRRVFSNRYIWILAVANFFVYTIRYAIFDWGPTMLSQSKGLTLSHAGWTMAGFETAGLVGTLAAGWLTDRVFGGRGARMCVFCMIGCAGALFLFWMLPPTSGGAITTLVLAAAGFFIYGPQALVGIAAANLATKEAAATAVGLTGLFGYGSGIVSGWGMGWLVQHHGWNSAFLVLMGVAGVGIALFLVAWPAPRDGYGTIVPASEFPVETKS